MNAKTNSIARPNQTPPALSPALSHPAWWVALGLLLVNDHLLKGAGWLPGWLTGKLSDFAFLLVAPPLAQTLLVRAPRRRLLAALTIAIPFVLAKLLPSCTRLLESLVSLAGIHWKLWTDPTDLVALLVLPAAFRLMGDRTRRPDRPRFASHILPRMGVALGALACVATSAIHDYLVRPFAFNATQSVQQIEVRWVLKSFACDMPLSQLSTSLQNGDLGEVTTLSLPSAGFAALDIPPRSGTSPIGKCTNDPLQDTSWDDSAASAPGPCPMILLQGTGLSPVLTRTGGDVSSSDNVSVCGLAVAPSDRPAGEIRIDVGSGGVLRWVAGPHVEMVDFTIPTAWSSMTPQAGTCGAILADYSQALQAGQSCAVDADCRPISLRSCDAVDSTAASSVESNLTSYSSAGCLYLPSVCDPGHAAICVGGLCAIDCPTAQLDPCPVKCDAGLKTGDGCGNHRLPCQNDQGDVCGCDLESSDAGVVSCSTPIVPQGCRNWCAPLG